MTVFTDRAVGLSLRLELQAAVMQRALKSRLARQRVAASSRRREEMNMLAQQQQALAARTVLARQGLARLLSAGAGRAMQGMVASIGRLGKDPSIPFYEAGRDSGDAWAAWMEGDWEHASHLGTSCKMYVKFCRAHLFVAYGTNSPHWAGTTWKIFYDPASPSEAVLKGGSEGEEASGRPLEDFFADIATAKPCALAGVRSFAQRSYEWEPADVLFELLVVCAATRRWHYYLRDCLTRLERTV